MPFYFRKSISIGGIRLNFSKSGISYSASPIKGFRITTGQRGTYATVGSHGFYYRERLDKPTRATIPGDSRNEIPVETVGSIPTADVSSFVDASSERVISEINSRKSTIRTAPIIGIICGTCSLALFGCQFPIIGAITAVASTVATILAANYDRTQRTTSLHYELENEHPGKQRMCQILSNSMKVWRIHSRESNADWKRHAGASSLLGRKEAVVGKATPPCIETNIEVWGIKTGDIRLFFFPDYLFVLQGGKYGAVSYNSLTMEFSPTRFIEDSFAPRDATVVDYVWQYVRKDGGPDRRFSNNRQRPVAMYGLLILRSSSGLNLHFHCSNKDIAKQAAEELQRQKHQTQQSPPPQPPPPPEFRSAPQRTEQQSQEQWRQWHDSKLRQQNQEREWARDWSPQQRAEQHRREQQQREQQQREQQREQQQREQQQREQQQREQQQKRKAAQSAVKSDYEILQLPINATDEIITASYIRLAKMYHPDKVENLAPEYKLIAITRMKEINAAYRRLKGRQ